MHDARRAVIAPEATVLVVVAAGCAPAAQTTALRQAQRASHSRRVERPFGDVINHLAGAIGPTPLPFPGPSNSAALAVDIKGNVRVTDSVSNRALKLPAQ